MAYIQERATQKRQRVVAYELHDVARGTRQSDAAHVDEQHEHSLMTCTRASNRCGPIASWFILSDGQSQQRQRSTNQPVVRLIYLTRRRR